MYKIPQFYWGIFILKIISQYNQFSNWHVAKRLHEIEQKESGIEEIE